MGRTMEAKLGRTVERGDVLANVGRSHNDEALIERCARALHVRDDEYLRGWLARDAAIAVLKAANCEGAVERAETVAARLRALADRLESGHVRRVLYDQAEALSPRTGGR